MADREETIQNIRAVLISTSGGIPEVTLKRDYRSLINKDIPFRELGYPTLSSFLKSINGLRIFTGPMGQQLIDAVPDEQTGHISSLVSRTRKKSKGSRSKKGGPRYRGMRLPPPPPPPRSKKINVATPFDPKRAPAIPPRPLMSAEWIPPIVPQRQYVTAAQDRLSTVNGTNGKSGSPDSNSSGSSAGSAGTRTGPPKVAIGEAKSYIKTVSSNGRGLESAVNSQSWLQGSRFSRSQISGTPRSPTSIPPVRPTGEITPPPLHAAFVSAKPRSRLERTQTFNSKFDELEWFCLKYGYGLPLLSELKRQPLNKKPLFICVLKIKGEKFSTYPEEYPSLDLAKESVAEKALEELRKKHFLKEGEEPQEVVLQRVKEIVGTSVNGIYDHAIEEVYTNVHGVCLPTHWLTIVESCDDLRIERFNVNRVIIYPVLEASSAHLVPASDLNQSVPAPTATVTVNGCGDTGSLNGSGVGTGTSCLPKLSFPEDDTWDVFVTSASQEGIWVRLIGDEFDTVYNDAMNDVEVKLMTGNGVPVSHPIVNNFYIVKFDNCWSRVQLLDVDGQSGDVLLIDNGENDTIQLSELRELDDVVKDVPAQAIQCRLACVDMANTNVQDYLVNHIIGNSFVASILVRPDQDLLATIILYDTKTNEDALHVNSVLCDIVVGGVKVPVLPPKSIHEVCVSHVEMGCIYIQFKNRNLELLNLILDDLSLRDLLTEFGMRAYPSLKQMENLSSIYLVHSKRDPLHWRRGKIVSVQNHNRPIVRLIDYGYCESILLGDMFNLEQVLPSLIKFPPQAFQVKLHEVSCSDLVGGVVERIKDLAPPNQSILCKVVESSEDMLVVELFKRIPPNDLIVSINLDLQLNLSNFLNAPVTHEVIEPQEERVDPLSFVNTFHYFEEHQPMSTKSSSPPASSLEELTPLKVEIGSVENKFQISSVSSRNNSSCQVDVVEHVVNDRSLEDLRNIQLKRYSVPDVGSDYLDIFVTLSSNPSNFVVQPLSLVNTTFAQMMEEIQDFYETNADKLPVPSIEDMNDGACFMAKHPDDLQWYRAKLLTRINGHLVTVCFVDYGDINLINIDRLRFVEPQFSSIPTLAIRAKLHGVAPVNKDWSVEASVLYNDTVSNKSLVSKVLEKNCVQDIHSLNDDWEVSLQLFDTSGAEDIDISDLLIKNNHAVKC